MALGQKHYCPAVQVILPKHNWQAGICEACLPIHKLGAVAVHSVPSLRLDGADCLQQHRGTSTKTLVGLGQRGQLAVTLTLEARGTFL